MIRDEGRDNYRGSPRVARHHTGLQAHKFAQPTCDDFGNVRVMRHLEVVLLVIATACGPSSRNGDDGFGGDVDASNATGGSGDAGDGCSAAAKLVYVVDEDNELSQFDGSTKTFHDLGKLSCPSQLGATPFSMGVDRTATAWVLYSSGELFNVNTTTLACTKTSWNDANGLMQFGMGFSTDTVGGMTDTLFIAGGTDPTDMTAALNTLNTSTMVATPVGTVQDWPELTGNSNAELWGFFPDETSPRVEKINKTSGAAVTTYPETSVAGMATAWAFAFYGGDYWIFLMKDSETSTTVYQVDGTTGTIKSTTPTNTRTIVGAGVSTCAPIVIE